jgi:hypothetical protein
VDDEHSDRRLSSIVRDKLCELYVWACRNTSARVHQLMWGQLVRGIEDLNTPYNNARRGAVLSDLNNQKRSCANTSH